MVFGLVQMSPSQLPSLPPMVAHFFGESAGVAIDYAVDRLRSGRAVGASSEDAVSVAG